MTVWFGRAVFGFFLQRRYACLEECAIWRENCPIWRENDIYSVIRKFDFFPKHKGIICTSDGWERIIWIHSLTGLLHAEQSIRAHIRSSSPLAISHGRSGRRQIRRFQCISYIGWQIRGADTWVTRQRRNWSEQWLDWRVGRVAKTV